MGFANEKEPIVYYGYAIIMISYNFMPQLNTKTMVQFSYSRLYLGIKTISCRLLQGIGRMGMDWDLKKLHGPTLSSSNATPAKITENNIMVSASLNSRRPFRVTYSRKEIHAKKKIFGKLRNIVRKGTSIWYRVVLVLNRHVLNAQTVNYIQYYERIFCLNGDIIKKIKLDRGHL